MADQIINAFAGSELAATQLASPERIKVYLRQIASQINEGRMAASPPMQCSNLHEQISDVIIETSAQGSSILEVHIVDPAWTLLQRHNGSSFIDVDSSGYLWPPIEINFPAGESSAIWRLCQCRPTTDTTSANLVLTFEDRAASEMREYGGPVVSNADESRAHFIRRLVKEVRFGGKLPGVSVNGKAAYPQLGSKDDSIRFIALLDPSVFTAQDLAPDETSVPASAVRPKNPRNVNKVPSALLKQQQAKQVAAFNIEISNAEFPDSGQVGNPGLQIGQLSNPQLLPGQANTDTTPGLGS